MIHTTILTENGVTKGIAIDRVLESVNKMIDEEKIIQGNIIEYRTEISTEHIFDAYEATVTMSWYD